MEALEPQQILDKASLSIVVVESLDAGGTVIAVGSGVVIATGEVVTNCHIIEAGVKWQVKKANQVAPASPRFYDEPRDLCQLEAARAAYFARPISGVGSMADLQVGQRVYAVGSPGGRDLTLSEGFIAGFRQMADGSRGMIQTSAPISSGSSGGGLFDQDGRLVGITSFLPKDSQNPNFAMPATWALELPIRKADWAEHQRKKQREEQAAMAAAELRRKEEQSRKREDDERAAQLAAAQPAVLENKKKAEAEEKAAAQTALPQRSVADSAGPEQQAINADLPAVKAPGDKSAYVEQIQNKIQLLIDYPSDRAQQLRAEFALSVMGAGWLIRAELVQSSGDTQFDEVAQRAVWAAEPLHDARADLHFEGTRNFRVVLRSTTLVRAESTIRAEPGQAPGQPVAPVATAPRPTNVDESAQLRRFSDEISRVLGKPVPDRDYPRLARQKGWQGTAEVRLQIGADGKVKNALVGRSSGYEVLDQRAVELIKQILLPNVPSAFRAREFSVTVPVTFALINSPAPALQGKPTTQKQ